MQNHTSCSIQKSSPFKVHFGTLILIPCVGSTWLTHIKAFIVGKRVFFLGNHVKAVNNTVFEKSVKKSHFIIACKNGHLDIGTKFIEVSKEKGIDYYR